MISGLFTIFFYIKAMFGGILMPRSQVCEKQPDPFSSNLHFGGGNQDAFVSVLDQSQRTRGIDACLF